MLGPWDSSTKGVFEEARIADDIVTKVAEPLVDPLIRPHLFNKALL